MKRILLLLIILMNINSLKSKSFEILLDTNYKTCNIGDKVEFVISVEASNDFNSTIILRTEDFSNNLSFSENYLNPPYKKSKFIIQTKGYNEGTKIFKLYGVSGNLRSDVICTLKVNKNINWTKIKIPFWDFYDGTENKYLGFVFDNEQNVTMTGYNKKGLMIASYKNKNWDIKYEKTNAFLNLPYTIAFNGDSIWHTSYEGLVLAENGNVKIYNEKNSDFGDGEPLFIILDNIGNPFVIRENMFKTQNMFKFSYFHDGLWENLDEDKYTFFGYRIWEESRELLNSAIVDKNNNIWFINKFNKLFKLKNNKGVLDIEENNILNIDNFKYEKLYKDKEQNLWINDTLNKVFYNYKNDSLFTIEYPLIYGKAIRVFFNKPNELWYLTYQGLVHYKDSIFTFYEKEEIPIENYYTNFDMTVDKHNNLWLRRENEILIFNPYGLVEMPIISSIENTELIDNSRIFPNPSSDKIFLDLGDEAVAELVFYDILGNEIMSMPNYTNKSEIDISNLSIGTYTIQIQTNTGSTSQRFVISR